MLDTLFGSRNMQRILLFLFVNRKCYGVQLKKILQTALTPLQKTLQRLERGGIIVSYFEGKTRLYQFNPTYPLLAELENLLKQAYTLLSPHEKRSFYVARLETEALLKKPGGPNKVLLELWNRLKKVKSFKLDVMSREEKKKGTGEVFVEQGEGEIIFHEKGTWSEEIGFHNTYRWKIDHEAGVISLEHLRHGKERAVFLLHFAPSGTHAFSSVDSHLCEGDTYFGELLFNTHYVRLRWRVIGPKKNEELNCYYACGIQSL